MLNIGMDFRNISFRAIKSGVYSKNNFIKEAYRVSIKPRGFITTKASGIVEQTVSSERKISGVRSTIVDDFDILSIDNKGFKNAKSEFLLDNVEPWTTDDSTIIFMQNLGRGIKFYMDKIVKTDYKFSLDELVKMVTLSINYEINAFRKEESSRPITYERDDFKQKVDALVMVPINSKDDTLNFKSIPLAVEASRDFLLKNETIEHINNVDRSKISKSQLNKLPIQETNYSGVALTGTVMEMVGFERFNITLPIYLLKAMSFDVSFWKYIDNITYNVREINDYSKVENIKINVIDINNTPTYELSGYLSNTSNANKINIFSFDERLDIMAGIVHLLCMFKMPYLLTDRTEGKALFHGIFDFSESNDIEQINVITKDPQGFLALMKVIKASWWQIPQNIRDVEYYLKMFFPHKKSAAFADTLIMGELVILNGLQVLGVQRQPVMPKMQLPSVVGLLQIMEPQTYGLSMDTFPVVSVLYAQILKVHMYFEIINLIFLDLANRSNSTKEGVSTLDDRMFENYNSIRHNTFLGRTSEDKLWNVFYDTPNSVFFTMFATGFIEQLIKQVPMEDLYEEGLIKLPMASNFSIFSMVRPITTTIFTELFKSSVDFSTKLSNSNYLVTDQMTAISVINFLFPNRPTDDYSNLSLTIPLRNKEGNYPIEDALDRAEANTMNVRAQIRVKNLDIKIRSNKNLNNYDGLIENSNENSKKLKEVSIRMNVIQNMKRTANKNISNFNILLDRFLVWGNRNYDKTQVEEALKWLFMNLRRYSSLPMRVTNMVKRDQSGSLILHLSSNRVGEYDELIQFIKLNLDEVIEFEYFYLEEDVLLGKVDEVSVVVPAELSSDDLMGDDEPLYDQTWFKEIESKYVVEQTNGNYKNFDNTEIGRILSLPIMKSWRQVVKSGKNYLIPTRPGLCATDTIRNVVKLVYKNKPIKLELILKEIDLLENDGKLKTYSQIREYLMLLRLSWIYAKVNLSRNQINVSWEGMGQSPDFILLAETTSQHIGLVSEEGGKQIDIELCIMFNIYYKYSLLTKYPIWKTIFSVARRQKIILTQAINIVRGNANKIRSFSLD